MLDKNIKYDDCYQTDGITVIYFRAPKEMLKEFTTEEYSEAISMEISVEFPFEHIDPEHACTRVSPTRNVEDGTEDYDWLDVELPADEIDELLKLEENT